MAKKALGRGMASLIGNTNAHQSEDSTSSRLKEYKEQVIRSEKLQDIKRQQKKEILEEKNAESIGEQILLVSVSKIQANPYQPRRVFNEADIAELANSIKENGVLQPLLVTHLEKDIFQLIAGERRLRASKLAGLEMVPVIVKKMTERDKMIHAIVENVQRSDLNYVDEALSYYRLMEEFKLTQEEVAKKIGKERSSLANTVRILRLPKSILEQGQKGLLSFGHAKILASIKDREEIIEVAKIVLENQLSVRQVEELIKSREKTKSQKEESRASDDFDRDKNIQIISEKVIKLKEKLEQRTGLEFSVKYQKNGSGKVMIHFGDDAEFNGVYEFLMKR